MKIPSLAVIATIKNDPIGLHMLLKDLSKQTLLPQEIILVFAGEDLVSTEHIKSFEQLPIQRFNLSQEATRSQARNHGVEKSQSQVIAFTDAGCRLDPDWLKELIKPFSSEETFLVSGLTQGKASSSWEEAQIPYVLPQEDNISDSPLPATRNMAILRSTFLQFGGFTDTLNFAEDYAFSHQLKESGIHSVFAPKALVTWQPRKNIRDFFRMMLMLTAGTIQADLWLWEHTSMWFRYIALFLLFFYSKNFLGTTFTFFLILVFYSSYLFLRLQKFPKLSLPAKAWFLVLSPICDLAILSGTILGLVWRLQAEENSKR